MNDGTHVLINEQNKEIKECHVLLHTPGAPGSLWAQGQDFLLPPFFLLLMISLVGVP